MRKKLLSIITTTVVMSFALFTGCKDEEVQVYKEKVSVTTEKKVNNSTDKDSDDKAPIKNSGDKDDKTNNDVDTTDKGGGTTEKKTDEKGTSSEEETTPMDGGAGSQQTTPGEKETKDDSQVTSQSTTVLPSVTQPITQPTTQPTTQPATQPATQPTTQPVTQPATQPTTQNYGSVINKNTYDVEYYSRRGIPDAAYPVAENIINSILSTSMNEAQRVRAIHDWLVKNVNYDYDTANNISGATGGEAPFTAEGSLINKKAVCEGYSEGFLLLCWTAGIEARLIEGTGNGGAHEWNVVKVGGKWYQMDVTFDDPLVNGVVDYVGGNLSYDYFLITTADMTKNHVIASCYNDTLPSCVSTDYYEYAKQCTFEVKLGSTPFTIISSYAEADSAINSYNSQNIMKFALVYPEGSLDYNELLNRAVNITVNNLNVGISAGLTVSASVGYSIAIITLTAG